MSSYFVLSRLKLTDVCLVLLTLVVRFNCYVIAVVLLQLSLQTYNWLEKWYQKWPMCNLVYVNCSKM